MRVRKFLPIFVLIFALINAVKAYAAEEISVTEVSSEPSSGIMMIQAAGVPDGMVPFFYSWTVSGGQDDMTMGQGVMTAPGIWIYAVDAAAHNGEKGIYENHVYLLNAAGESVPAGICLSSLAGDAQTGTVNETGAVNEEPLPAVHDSPYLIAQAVMDEKVSTLTSPTGVCIAVDKYTNIYGIYVKDGDKWNAVKTGLCTTGVKHSTPSGIFSIGRRGRAFGTSEYTCYYFTGFIGSTYLFHSVLYYPGTMKIKDGRLGKCLSHGCVRLDINDAKYIHDFVPEYSTVLVY